MTIIKKSQFDENKIAPLFNSSTDSDDWDDENSWQTDESDEDDAVDVNWSEIDDDDSDANRDRYAAMIDDLTRQINEAGQALLKSLPEITAEAVRLAIGRVDARKAVTGAVNAVIAERNLSAPLRVLASPADAELLTEHQQEGGLAQCEIVVDPLLADGEAIVESLLGRIHAGPTARGKDIARAITRGQA